MSPRRFRALDSLTSKVEIAMKISGASVVDD